MFFTYFEVFCTPVINLFRVRYILLGLVFHEKIKTIFEFIIHEHLFPSIKTTIRCWFPLCFAHELFGK